MSLSDAIAKIEGFWRHPDFSAAGWNRYEAMKRALLENDAIERAEVAALKARPAMAWRRREDVTLKRGRYLIMLKARKYGETLIPVRYDQGRFYDISYGFFRTEDITHIIPWSDLTPPGGEDAS